MAKRAPRRAAPDDGAPPAAAAVPPPPAAAAPITCGVCGREQNAKPTAKGEPRLPPGWHRLEAAGGLVYCRDCWGRAFVLRAVTLPVATVVAGGDWADFFTACKSGWKAATDVANWAVFELARSETPRTAETERLPKQVKPYLYPGARAVGPSISPSSTVAVLHAVEGKYSRARLATMWFRKQALPVYRYPMPLPLHNQAWDAVELEGGRPGISLMLEAGRRWTIALSTHNRKRQLSAWRQILTGAAVKGELAIIGQEVTASDNKQGGEDRDAGGGRRTTMRIMAKMVAWFPKREARERDGTLYLRTSSEAFWTYHVGSDGELKFLRAEHVKRWEAQHRRHLRGMADDLKFEKRWPAEVRRQAGERQDVWVRKYKDRIKSFCHEASSMIANFADRRGVATVVYDPADKSYVDRFPWHQVEEMLKYKLDERGITLEIVAKKQPAVAAVDGDE